MQSSTISNVGATLGRIIVHAEGNYITDKEGCRYLDFAMGMGSCFLGHNPPEVVNALRSNLDKLIVGQFYNIHRDRLLLALESILPPELNHVFLFNTGAEAIESALLLSRRITGKDGVVRFQGCFHGKSYLTASLDTTGFREQIGISQWDDNIILLPERVNQLASINCSTEFERVVFQLESIIKKRKNSLSAIIIEPIQGSYGNIDIPPKLLKILREISTREGILLIVDEIASGFGRSGEPFAFNASGIVPDILTGGKAISSGYPIGLTILSTDLAQRAGLIQPGMTSTTFGGNSLSCLVASVCIETITQHALWNKARTMGDYFRSKLETMATFDEEIRYISGRGLMLGIELDNSFKITGASLKLTKALLDQGIVCQISKNRIRLLPGVRLTQQEIDRFVESLHKAIRKVRSGNA